MTTTRRDFLRLLGLGAAAAAAPDLIVEPVRRMWFVPSSAPVGSRVERPDYEGFIRALKADARGGLIGVVPCDHGIWDAETQSKIDRSKAMVAEYGRLLDEPPLREMAQRLEYGAARLAAAEESYARAMDEPATYTVVTGWHQEPSDPSAEPRWQVLSVAPTQEPALREMEYYRRDMELADSYAKQLKTLESPIHNALLKGPWYVLETWR